MKRNIFKFIRYALLLFLVIFSVKIFLPRNYNVPQLKKRATTHYMNLPTGSKIGYTIVTGKGDRKPYPVIYLHGGPGGSITDRTIEMLTPLSDDGYDVFLYDQIGSGQSGRLDNIEDYTVKRHIRDLEEIIKQLKTEKVILIGQSWGSILAILFTAENSEKVEKIIFTSPGPIYPVRPELAKTIAPDSFHFRDPYFTNAKGNETANNLRTRAMNFFATSFGKKIASDKEADDFATYLNHELNKSTVCDTSKIPKEKAGSGFYAGIMTLKNLYTIEDPRPKILNLKIPVLVMKGQCDNQKWGFTNEYLQLFKNAQLAVIPDAGHYISVEQPKLYIETIKSFLSRGSFDQHPKLK